MIVNLPVPAEAENVVGHVVAVSGSRLSVDLVGAAGTRDSSDEQVRIGDLLRIESPDGSVFGIVQSLCTTAAGNARDVRHTVDIDVFGEMSEDRQHFQRGVSRHPVLGADVRGSTREDLAQIFAPTSNAVTRIGAVHQDRSLPAYVLVDQLLGKHFAVLGTTGSGKSCTVTLIRQVPPIRTACQGTFAWVSICSTNRPVTPPDAKRASVSPPSSQMTRATLMPPPPGS